jgi:hypothetical protein
VSVFSDAEIDYLGSQRLGRLATVGQDGMPHVVPVAFRYNPDTDSIDVGGHDFAKRKKVPRRPADGQIRAAPAGERSHGRRTARARISHRRLGATEQETGSRPAAGGVVGHGGEDSGADRIKLLDTGEVADQRIGLLAEILQ